MKKLSFLLVAVAVVATTGNFVAVAETNPLVGKIIALDAGHGGTELGAQYPANCANDGIILDCLIFEKDVNLAVVVALESKLKVQGSKVVIAERFSTRRDRVNDAVAKCAAFDLNNDGVGDKCDVLVSVHHNGNTDSAHDGTLTIYTQNSDKPLAKALYDSLLPLTNQPEGMLNGGYGMTVFKNLVSTITEAYYITNDCEADLYRYSIGDPSITDLSKSCKDKGYILENRIDHEAQLQVEGLRSYFSDSQTGGKGGKPSR